MSRIDKLLSNYSGYVSLPWENVAGPQRIWFAVYDKTDERRLRLRLAEFEIETKKAKHGWAPCDVTDCFASWMAGHEYREAYFERPEDMQIPHPDFEAFVGDRVKQVLNSAGPNDVVGLVGVGSLFGVMRASSLMMAVENSIQGRLLVFFPGEYDNNNYRLLDARDGWNYHAVPITASGGLNDR